MTEHELNKRYFEWIMSLVDSEEYFRAKSYRKLLYRLYNIEFTYSIPMDANRASDGIDLRYTFGIDQGYDDPLIATYLDTVPCSVLEMMVALAVRCETHIMSDPEIGDRTGLWFRNMLRSLGLDDQTNTRFDENIVDAVISRFLNRQYSRDGHGGLYILKDSIRDLRYIEIWHQMNWYLDEYERSQRKCDD